jgi:hypothetical protein
MVLIGAVVGAGAIVYALLRTFTIPRNTLHADVDRPARENHLSANALPASSIRRRRWEMMGTIGTLHTAFLLGFYGWTGSWTYYSYLAIWGIVLAVAELQEGRPRAATWAGGILTTLLVLSHGLLIAVSWDGWAHKVRIAGGEGTGWIGGTGGLWVYPDQWAAWQNVLQRVDTKPAIVMTNGWVPDLPANVHMPDAWFPEPGIPTATEVARVQKQVDAAQYVIVYWEYRDFDLWNAPTFAPQRAAFVERYRANYPWGWFTLLER